MRDCVSKESLHRRVVQAAVLKRLVYLPAMSASAAQLFAASEVANLVEARGSGREECGAFVWPCKRLGSCAVMACAWNRALYVCGRAS